MTRLPLVSVCLVVATASTAAALAARTLQDLEPGIGRETTIRLCKSCHPMDRVVQAPHSYKEWIRVIEQMQTQGATGTDNELNEAIDYLTDQYGKAVNMNTAKVEEMIDFLGFDKPDAAKIVAYRADHPNFTSWKDVAAVPGVDAAFIERRQKNLTFETGTGNGVSTVTGRPHVVYGR